MSLEIVKSALSTNTDLATRMSFDAWIADEEARGEIVKKCREYADGEHAANMTPEMRKLLRLPSNSSGLEFNDNYMDIIVQTMVDRLTVTGMDAENEAAAKWCADLMTRTRFDGVQNDVHEAAVRDGDAYVMVSPGPDNRPQFTYEPAYDGMNGVIVLYESFTAKKPMLAVKIWQLMPNASDASKTTVRFNVYYEDRMESYIQRGNAPLEQYEEPGRPFSQPYGTTYGMPIIHFRNRRTTYNNHGISELNNAIPLQDALNRGLYSMVIASELTAFRVLVARGFVPPAEVTPGMIISIGDTPLGKDEIADLNAIDGAELTQYIKLLEFYANEMGKVTRTPSPEFMGGDNASGEALKQRESGLLGKVKRFHTSAGNSWEDAFTIAAAMERVYAPTADTPKFDSLTTRWKDPHIRNDKERIEMVKLIADYLDDRTLLELVAEVYDFNKEKIDEIIANKAQEAEERMQTFGRNLPNFDSAGQGLEPMAATPNGANGNGNPMQAGA